MRKNILSAAVVAAMGGVAGVANAVNVNPDGTGEVLLYPYYSVENGNDTYINVVNTTDQVKMVKVRFREAMNSQEVLDFNLYMSPHDEWSGAISATADGGAQFNSEDNSCTTPMNVSDVAFRTFKFDGTLGAEDSVSGVERTRTGYVELIEMAEIDPTSAFGQAVTHDSDGVADCATANGYVDNGGQLQGVTLSEPAGGLYGFGMLVNVDRATDVQYDAVALDGVYSSPSNAGTGSDDPSLADADPSPVYIFDNGSFYDLSAIDGTDAVSAVLSHDAVMNDYLTNPLINAATDWVVNFPTKRLYDGSAPFTTAWDNTTSTACEEVSVQYYDQEEQFTQSDVDFSPQPPSGSNELCYEANVIQFGDRSVVGHYENGYQLNLADGFDAGWVNLGFNNAGAITLQDNNSSNLVDVTGLPTIGFAAMEFQNAMSPDGLTKNVAGATVHKASRDISVY